MVEITLEGPAKNALSGAMMDTLITAIEAAGHEPLLLVGAGDSFSAGLNLKELASLDVDGMRTYLHKLVRLLDLLYRHPAPTVAAVNGHAIAGGCLVELVCDHRVATDDPKARIGLNEVAIGVQFPPFVLRLVEARLGRRFLTEITLGAGLYAPRDAIRLGLVDEVAADCVEVARERLSTLAAHPRAVYAATKRALRPPVRATEAEQRLFEEEVLPVWTGPDLKARIAAMFAKKR